MVQGTTSDAGKSALVTALCRYYFRQGISVAPFKPQNMALNSAVTIDGGEIGRAQAVQAAACGLEPEIDMNPILLKPNSDKTAQVIVHGKASQNLSAKEYHCFKKQAMKAVLESHTRLCHKFTMVIVEGAGSPAEINLREDDIANMGFAEEVDCPVILIADIDKGGVFAHIVGTLDLLSESEQKRIIGFVINRFRGDIELLQPGLDWLEKRTKKPVLAVIPYLHDLYLDAEDSVAMNKKQTNKGAFNIVVPRLPRISNHTDFDPLFMHPGVNILFSKDPEGYGATDLVILPGSKSVRNDLDWLKKSGWSDYIKKHLRYGGRVLGVCGGFQMLGDVIHDPEAIEGKAGSTDGLGLLSMETTLKSEKCLKKISGFLLEKKIAISGYEIHAGFTHGVALSRPVMELAGEKSGALSKDNQVMGTYLHGLFDSSAACDALLAWAGNEQAQAINLDVIREKGIDLMTDALQQHFDFEKLGQVFEPL